MLSDEKGEFVLPAVQIVPSWTRWFVPSGDLPTQILVYRRVMRVLVVLALLSATYYILWRYFYSINWTFWPVALALLMAETYSYIDAWLFGLGLWRLQIRAAPQPPISDATVDVFISCYSESVELVRETAVAAHQITWPHRTFILDDGQSPEMAAMAAEVGVEYITRSSIWHGKDSRAKADNLLNAMEQTNGEFILVLDADQVPSPEILTKTLGHFRDPQVAFVQTPQWFQNIPAGDPFGSAASLFYGPIQQGKDGWDAAYFCGSNALLRREALMSIGDRYYVRDQMRQIRRAVRATDQLLRQAADNLRSPGQERLRDGMDRLRAAIKAVNEKLQGGATLEEANSEFQREAETVRRLLAGTDLAAIQAELGQVLGLDDVALEDNLIAALTSEGTLEALLQREISPLAAATAVRALLLGLALDHSLEAEPAFPIASISLSDDMTTAIRLHASGWKSVYHHENLARGLAPQDLYSAMQQRLRWAQGTIQGLLRENPLAEQGLAVGQRLMYFSTLWRYLSGFFNFIYLIVPVLYLLFGWLPIREYSRDFFWHLIPFLVAHQLLFLFLGWGLPTWRGRQVDWAMFPLWIRAVTSAVGNVCFGRNAGFGEMRHSRQADAQFNLVRPQLVMMGLIAIAILFGLTRLLFGNADDVLAVLFNVIWSAYNLVMLSVVIPAATYSPENDSADGHISTAATGPANSMTAAAAHGRIAGGRLY